MRIISDVVAFTARIAGKTQCFKNSRDIYVSSAMPHTKRRRATFPRHLRRCDPQTTHKIAESTSGERRTSSCDAEPHVHRLDPTIAYLHLEIAPVRCNCTVYVNRRRAAPRVNFGSEVASGTPM